MPDTEEKKDGESSGQVGYLVDDGLWGSHFDPQYCDAWGSFPGATDLVGVQECVQAAFNGLAKAACVNGGKLLLTGGAETINPNTGEHFHAQGPYGHEGGWKLDVDPTSVNDTCGRDTFLDLCTKYGCAAGDEGDHYDLAFNSEGGVGGTQVATPETYLGNGETINSSIKGGGSKRAADPKGGGAQKRNEAQYAGFKIMPKGKDTVKITKLPEKKTFAEPIYPDLVMVSDFVPKWALDAAATVINVTDDSMIQWGKSTNKQPDGKQQNSGGGSSVQKEYEKFSETFNKYKKDRYEAWKKETDGGNEEAYQAAASEHPEQFEHGIYVGTDETERKKAKELGDKETDFESKLKEEETNNGN